jgi:exo beta-1,2-glucooligosaccharide sophorohydrolase (non-reducing end)
MTSHMSVWTRGWRATLLALSLAATAEAAPGENAYYAHVVFDNSQQPGAYWYSDAVAVAPSSLERSEGRIPVDSSVFHSPPNALRLAWTSREGGGW